MIREHEGLSGLIAEIPFEDHHVHPPFREDGALSLSQFRRPFTESPIEATWNQHLPTQIAYRWMVRDLAALLDVESSEDVVLDKRSSIAVEEYHRTLADHANLGASYADDLFAQADSYDMRAWSRLLGDRPVRRVLRIETFVEQGYSSCVTLDDALQNLTAEVLASRENDVVSLKSIAGYRSGLAFAPPSAAQRRAANHAYDVLRENALSGGSGRIANKALVDTIVWTALEAGRRLCLPMQFHVALGDDDIVMTRNDPTLMRALFEHQPFREIPLVLLHCYPYHRQAGYLASIYPNVYVDLGLTIPLVGPAAPRIVEEALELTPISQLLASTDGHMTPEFQWFGIRVWRWALERTISGYVDAGVMPVRDVAWIASAILRDNAQRIYPQWND